jgi:hypothetical protein
VRTTHSFFLSIWKTLSAHPSRAGPWAETGVTNKEILIGSCSALTGPNHNHKAISRRSSTARVKVSSVNSYQQIQNLARRRWRELFGCVTMI